MRRSSLIRPRLERNLIGPQHVNSQTVALGFKIDHVAHAGILLRLSEEGDPERRDRAALSGPATRRPQGPRAGPEDNRRSAEAAGPVTAAR